MRPISKKIFAVSACCIAAGAVLGITGFLLGGHPGITVTSKGIQSASSSPRPAVMEKQKIESISELDIQLDSGADIRLAPSGDENYYLEYTLDRNYGEPRLDIDGGQLHLTQEDNLVGGLFLFDSLSYGTNERFSVTLYYPEDAVFSSADIYTGSGDLSAEKFSADTAVLSADYGDIQLSDSDFGSLEIQMEDGDISAVESAAKYLALRNEYGDTEFEKCTINHADFTIEDGDLYLDAKDLEALSGKNEYGDTTFVLHGSLSEYSFDLTAEYGDIHIPGTASGKTVRGEDGDEIFYQTSGQYTVTYTVEDGDITVRQP